jgi:polyphosphate:AMP phosphotransferase
MFETAEIGRKVPKSEYKTRAPQLREQLLDAQQQLRAAAFKVVVVFAGVDGAGKGDTVNLLHEWMDPRWLITRAYSEPSQEERERPEYWRYWRDLPPRGRIGLFLSSWYSRPVLDRVYGRVGDAELDRRLDRVAAFENALAADGALILKFWMHLSRKAQKKRLKTLEKDPLLSWRVTPTDWEHWRMYDGFVAAAERAILKTSAGHALWHIVEGEDVPYRSLTVGNTLLEAIRRHMAARAERSTAPAVGSAAAPEPTNADELMPTVLSTLDMSAAIPKKEYAAELKRLQGRLNRLHRDALERQISTLVVMEGWDAAGKGGAIRRCVAALDTRHVEVIPFAAPTEEERQHHYLWRFWRHLGRAGRVTFFDRSWYGRVLVERVEGFARETEWQRAYAEIVDFEEQLIEHGIVLVKFWMHITPEEQLARFREREQTPWKRWKLTDEDWRNREKWPLYEQAVNDMVAHTSTSAAPWTLVEGNDKRHGRIKVLATLCDRLETALRKSKKRK